MVSKVYIFVKFYITAVSILVLLLFPYHIFAATIIEVSKDQASTFPPYQTSSSNFWVPTIEFQGSGTFDTVCMIPGFAGSPGSAGIPILYNLWKTDGGFPNFTSGTFYQTDVPGSLPVGNTDVDPANWEFTCASFSTPIPFSPGDTWLIAIVDPGGTVILSGDIPSPYPYLRTTMNTGWLSSPTNFSGGSYTASYDFSVPVIVSLGPPSPPQDVTKIETVTPPDDPTFSNARATSTTFAFGVTGSVASSQFVEGMRVTQRYFNNVSAAQLAVGPAFSEGGQALCNALPNWLCFQGSDEPYVFSGAVDETFTWEITSAGDFSFSTTTDIQVIGQYTLFTEISRPNSFLGLFNTGFTQFVSTTTQFMVATSSSYDRAVGTTVQSLLQLNDPNNPACDFDFTNPSNYFDQIQYCLSAILQVPYDYVGAQIQAGLTSMFSHAPWGYGIRAYNILTTPYATSTLPTVSFTFPFGPQQGVTYDFTPWEYCCAPDSFLSQAETPGGQPVLPILLTGFSTIVYLLYAIFLLSMVFLFFNSKNHD